MSDFGTIYLYKKRLIYSAVFKRTILPTDLRFETKGYMCKTK